MNRLLRHLTDNLLVSVTVCFLAGAAFAHSIKALDLMEDDPAS